MTTHSKRAWRWLRGWVWELQGYYKACRGYGRQGRLSSLRDTITRGWRDG